MKNYCRCIAFTLLSCFVLLSCSPESVASTGDKPEIAVAYDYTTTELETLNLVNNYRKSIGLNALEKINFISVKSEQHVNYMIVNNVVNHNDFDSRSNEIIKVLGAKNVSENIAYNYATPAGAFDAWLRSDGHKENLEGNFTHFGISVRKDPSTGKTYYVNIFAKI